MHPDGASVRYLSEQVVVSPSRVSRLADEFVVRGWLERAVSHQDGRLSLVRLTSSGRKALAAMEQTFADALQEHLLAHLSDAQLASLVDVGRTLGAPHC
jgi:DNA-binding MarR family transcriptional regulator